MKKLGMIGGTGPESTIDYYQSIIAKFQQKTGDAESLPELLISSVNMYKIFELLDGGRLDGLADYLAQQVTALEKGGAEFAVISANTPHIVFDQVQKKAGIPMISIVEETVRKAEEMNLSRIALLGTKFTMENTFFKTPFETSGRKVFVPTEAEQQSIHRKIVNELEKGVVREETKKEFLAVIERMTEEHGVEGVILGCTELPMILKPEDLKLPQLNTVEIHVEKIVEMMLD